MARQLYGVGVGSEEAVDDVSDRKRLMRVEMRAIRLGLDDRNERSRSIWAAVQARPEVIAATKVMAYTSIPGEPDTVAMLEWCVAEGKGIAVPEDAIDPTWPDVIIVPGLAFTEDGRRCGQGGGWYDRYLNRVRAECTTIGVCFAPQLVADVPTEPHDIVLDAVVTD
jgi:5-formyltetrahydrofolate cyclo-ligase